MEQILNIFPNLTLKQRDQLGALLPLYLDWNSKINVISRKDINNLYSHHVLHSLLIAKIFNFVPGTVILDSGTGGGFPGLPLAILFPECNFVLADSVGKKLLVIDSIASSIGLKNIKTIHTRVEDLNEQYDFVVSRAVARLDTSWGWTHRLISGISKNPQPNGLIYLKGGDITSETPKGIKTEIFELSRLVPGDDFYKEKSLIYLHQ